MANIMEFNGTTNLRYGVVVTSLPPIPTPEERGEDIEIPGRNGSLWRGDGSYRPVTITVPIWVPPKTSLTQVRGWLTGSGPLKFDDGTLYWDARVSGETHFAPRDFYEGYEGTVTFTCQPFRRVKDEEIVVDKNPMPINNPYSAYAEPLIAVTCTGEFTLTVNGTICTIADCSGEVMLDSELQEAFIGNALINDKMTGAFPVLTPGDNVLSYEGAVTKIRIKPRWRTL